MSRKTKWVLGAAALALSLTGCLGAGSRGPVGAVADRHVVVYPPYETVRMVRCPVCGGTGTLQRSYVAFPRPSVPYMAPAMPMAMPMVPAP